MRSEWRRKWRYLKAYLPWLAIILMLQFFAAALLWLADVRIFQALFVLMLLFSLLLFGVLASVLSRREMKKERAIWDFVHDPDDAAERKLKDLCGPGKRELIEASAQTLAAMRSELERSQTQLSDYEDYVEMWTHEIKLPLSLLALVLDNREAELTGELAFKLDYVRNQIQNQIDQILFYYRIRSGRKDYYMETLNVGACVRDVLAENKALLEESRFQVVLRDLDTDVFSDRRSLQFIFGQILANAMKYGRDEESGAKRACASGENGGGRRLRIEAEKNGAQTRIHFRDNGCGVKACDLPYIFEKGFTGDSGEKRKKSTGMGLFLVKQAADDLKIAIDVQSVWTQGFEITLSF